MSQFHSVPSRARPAQQAYVIELGEAQTGLVSRRADERGRDGEPRALRRVAGAGDERPWRLTPANSGPASSAAC